MVRTNTSNRSSFIRSDSVTYTLPTPPYSSPKVRITLPPHSTWTSGLHWHETHTEFLQIISGTALITLNSVTKTYDSSSGIITVPRYARHEWRRMVPDDGQVLEVHEWTDPADGQKEVFFRNLSSVILDCTKDGPPAEWWLSLQLFVVFWGLDNYPVFLNLEKFPIYGKTLEWIVTHLILFIAMLIGKMFGCKSVYAEYTPIGLQGNEIQKID